MTTICLYQHKIKHVLLLCLIALVAACGGGGSHSPSSDAAPNGSSVAKSSQANQNTSNSSGANNGGFNFDTQAPALFKSALDVANIPDLGASQMVAATQGALSVANGSAEYKVDIDLPPAVIDLKPKLALTYNSRSSNGLMGLGWNVSGLSVISRCRASFAIEGAEAQKSNPRYTNGDRLCLDGKKLVLADASVSGKDANYWVSGAKYKTEIDSFGSIEASGSANGAHAYFKIKTKDGRTLTYGGETDQGNARIYRPGQPNGAISTWALNKVEDAYGNSYSISYIRDTANGAFYPKQIDFAPEASVVFSYQDRLGQTPTGYDMGQKYSHKKILEKITTYIGVANSASAESGMAVKQYKMGYKLSDSTQRELVDSITECGYKSGNQECAKPLIFQWQKGEFGFSETAYNAAYCDTGKVVEATQFVDMDGDGYSDGLSAKGLVSWGTPEGCFVRADWTKVDASISASPFMTKNGFGYAWLGNDSLNLLRSRFISKTDRTAKDFILIGTWGNPYIVQDMNNDGLGDIYTLGKTYVHSLSKEYTFVPSGNIDGSITGQLWNQDLDGDGISDLLKVRGYGKNDYRIESKKYQESTFSHLFNASAVSGSSSVKNVPFMALADINGDGLKDYVIHSMINDVGHWIYRLNKQDGAVGPEVDTAIVAASNSNRNHYSFPYDYDKDGREDLIAIIPTGTNQCKLRVLLAREKNGEPGLEEAKDSSGSTLIFSSIAGSGYCWPADNSNALFKVMSDINNDGVADARVGSTYYLGKSKQPDLLIGVSDGFGAETKVDFSTLTKEIYTPDAANPVFPLHPASRNMQVVKAVSTSDGAGGFNVRAFTYAGAKVDLQGRGFLGFASITSIDSATSVIKKTDYSQIFPFVGRVTNVLTKTIDGALIDSLKNEYLIHPNNPRFPYLDTSIRQSYQLLSSTISSPISVTKIKNTFDSCSNLTQQITKIGSGFDGVNITGELSSQDVVNKVDNGTADCSDDFITKRTETVTKTATGETQAASTEFTPNNAKDIATKTTFKDSSVESTTIFGRESNGIVNSIEVAAKDIDGSTMPVRKTIFSDFAKGVYPQTTTNQISAGDHASVTGYDFRFGEVNVSTNPNGLRTEQHFDSLGRLVESLAADKTRTELISFYCAGATVTCPGNAVYGVATRVTNLSNIKLGAPLTIKFYDVLQREVRRSTYSLGGAVISIATEYRADGRIAKVSEPYNTAGSISATAATAWTLYSDYDALGRAHTVTAPDGGNKTTTFSKDGIHLKTVEAITVKNSQGVTKDTQTTTRYLNPLGQVTKVEDANNTPVAYDYDSAGNLIATIVNNNINTQITIAHDIAGNKTHIIDPDAGIIDFEYNGFDELRRQTWRKGTADAKSITYGFDQLGRKTTRIDQPVSGTATSYSWLWDTKQKGELTSVTGNGQTIEYGYDGYSRPSLITTKIAGLADKVFSTTYDEFSRPETITYPNGFRIQRLYHAAGYQMQTKDVSDSTNPRVLWAVGNEVDVRGNITSQLWGNGVVTNTSFDANSGRINSITSGHLSSSNQVANLFGDVQALSYASDSLGNLESRSSKRTSAAGVALENLSESYVYDKLNRLTNSTAADSLFSRVKSYGYDELGNLTSRTSYSTLGNSVGTNEDVGVLSYSRTDNAGVHAVTAAGATNYQYDKYGNMVNRGSETITYDVFNKPTRISGTVVTDISYGADHGRFKEVDGSTSTYSFMGGLYEEEITGVTTTQKSYVDGVVINTKILSGSVVSSNDISYLHNDQLGSVEAISNKLGAFVARMSFSDWGNRQQADWKSGSPSESFPTANGFTGHHELDKHKLVHMGGRVYDPNLGRFLSADLLVQSPYSSQSFNRYTYVANNPLSRIDPTGYEDVETVVVTGSVDNSYNSGTNTSTNNVGSFGSSFSLSSNSIVSPVWSATTSPTNEVEVETITVTGYKKSSQDKNGVGLGGRYSPNKSGWHDYTLSNVVCPAKDRCTAPEMKDQLIRFAAPGQDPSKPIVNGQVSMVIDPRPIISMAGYSVRLKAGNVKTYVSEEGFSIINVTQSGHLLYDGQITRTLSLNGNGDWIVTTHGIGNNSVWWQLGLGAAMNEWQGPKIFNYVDAQMIDNIQSHH